MIISALYKAKSISVLTTNKVLKKHISAIAPQFSGPKRLSDKAKLFAEIFSDNHNLDDSNDSSISLLAFFQELIWKSIIFL